MMTEIETIDGGQKDALLRRANMKKIFRLGLLDTLGIPF